MKELTIEQKAQRYDEAIDKFDVILNLDIVKKSGTIFADDVRKILPELKESGKESEDEMITIKSYTDLEQSKKLAEILPLESSDMHSEAIYDEGNMIFIVVDGLGDKTKSNYGSPVWSLAALLDILPCKICDDEGESADLSIYKKDRGYQLVYKPSLYEDFDNIVTDVYENFIDTCVAMIESLHKLNLI